MMRIQGNNRAGIDQAQGRRWAGVGWMLGALIVLLVATGLRAWQLGSESIWHDEGWSIRAIREPFTTPDDNTPFAYYGTLHLLWRSGAGESPLAFRYGSVLIGVATVAAAFALARRWYGLNVAIAAGALAAVNPLLWEYAQEVRAYVAVPLIALGLLWAADQLLRRERHSPAQDWALIFAMQWVGLYTHNLTVPLVVWLNAALGVIWLLRRDLGALIRWALLEAALVAAYLPWLLTQSPSGTPLNTPPPIGPRLFSDIWAAYHLPALTQWRDQIAAGEPLLIAVTLLGALTVIAALALIAQARKRGGAAGDRAWLLITHALFVPAFSTVLMLAANIDFHPRYFIAAVPGTLIVLAAGLGSIRIPLSAAASAAVLIGVGISAASLHQITTTGAYQHDDFEALADYYATLPPGSILLLPFPDEPALQAYLADRAGIRARFVNLPLHADESQAVAALNDLAADGPVHVELLTWFQLPADPRGMYRCLLRALSVQPPLEPMTFAGLMTQSFYLDGSLNFTPIEAAPRYAEVELRAAGYQASEHGLCLRTLWALTTDRDDDLSAAAWLIDAAGGEVARSDAIIARDDQAGTSAWRAGETGAAYHTLTLPEGSPSAAYDLALNVYSPGQPSGIDLLDAAGSPAGVVYRLPSAVITRGPAFEVEDEAPTVPTLQSDNAGEGRTIQTGVPLEVMLLLPGISDFAVDVILAGEGWSLRQTAQYIGQPVLSAHTFTVEPGNSGQAVLTVDGIEVARYTVVDPLRMFAPPVGLTQVGVAFPGVGRLYGADVPALAVSPTAPVEVTLIWEASATPPIAYTVFAQLIAADGRLLAQSDMMPAASARPTTGWIAGEYITDVHQLRWNITDYTGPATLIAGFYDASSGNFERVRTENGEDHAALPLVIEVEG
jgi:hypothetical protein